MKPALGPISKEQPVFNKMFHLEFTGNAYMAMSVMHKCANWHTMASRVVPFPIFPSSQVVKMVRVPIFPGSQVVEMVRLPIFPGSGGENGLGSSISKS